MNGKLFYLCIHINYLGPWHIQDSKESRVLTPYESIIQPRNTDFVSKKFSRLFLGVISSDDLQQQKQLGSPCRSLLHREMLDQARQEGAFEGSTVTIK